VSIDQHRLDYKEVTHKHTWVLKAQNVGLVYGSKDKQSVQGICVDKLLIPSTGVTAVIGPSGAGKSTLLGVLSALRPVTPSVSDATSTLILSPRSGPDVDLLQRQHPYPGYVSFVFQDSHLILQLSAKRNAELGIMLSNGRQAGSLVEYWAKAFAVEHLLNTPVAKLSGGERQRIAIIRALANDPSLLFCDEPTSSLDALTSESVMSEIHQWSRKQGRSVLWVTHDLSLAARFSDRLVCVGEGKITTKGGWPIDVPQKPTDADREEFVFSVYKNPHEHVADLTNNAPKHKRPFSVPLRDSGMQETTSDRSLLTNLSTPADPRCAIKQRYRLNDMIAIAITGVLCGAEGWALIAEFGRDKQAWLKRFMELPYGTPMHDTFERVFSLIDPDVLEDCFSDWVETLRAILPSEEIVIDGKMLRSSYDWGKGLGALHLVSVWAENNRLVFGQVATEAKSNEITTIPKLLDLMLIQGCIVTIDVMSYQAKIAAQIVDQGADYVLALKGNQSTLDSEVEKIFIDANAREYVGLDYQFLEIVEQEHGRRETRRYRTLCDLSGVSGCAEWKALKMIGMVESEYEIDGVTSRETRYYIASIGTDVSIFAHAVRGHWGVENQLHWSLDVAFNEDASRARDPDARENLAVMQRTALTRLEHDDTELSIQSKRIKAAWSEAYLEKLLFEAPKTSVKSSTSKSSNIRKT